MWILKSSIRRDRSCVLCPALHRNGLPGCWPCVWNIIMLPGLPQLCDSWLIFRMPSVPCSHELQTKQVFLLSVELIFLYQHKEYFVLSNYICMIQPFLLVFQDTFSLIARSVIFIILWLYTLHGLDKHRERELVITKYLPNVKRQN